MAKYFIKLWWESSGKNTVLLEEQYRNQAEKRAEQLKKDILEKLKELGSEGDYSDVGYSIEEIKTIL